MTKKIFALLIALFVFTNIANAQWQQTNWPYAGVVPLMAFEGNNLLATTYSDGVYLSTNNGNSWAAINTGLTNTFIVSLAVIDSIIFVGTASGIFSSCDTGNNWTLVNASLPNTVTSFAKTDSNLIVGTWGGGICLSTNNGTTWNNISTGITGLNYINTILIKDTNIFACTAGSGIYLSSDIGLTWNNVSVGLTNSNVTSIAIVDTIVFVGTSNGVFQSIDNGANWTPNLDLPITLVNSLTVHGANIYVGTDCCGVYLSSNNGTNWTAVNAGLTNLEIHPIVVCDSFVYAGTWGSGVWSRSLSNLLSIDDINGNNSIAVYPNPSINSLTIEAQKQSTIEIININGQIVKTVVCFNKSTSVDLTDLSRGVYIVRVKTDKKIVTKKIIKE